MVDLSLYNHILYAERIESDSYQDDNGIWHNDAESSWEEVSECRLDRLSSVRVNVVDGDQKVISATIYTPRGVESVEDKRIQVRDKITGDILFEGIATSHILARLHTTITAQ